MEVLEMRQGCLGDVMFKNLGSDISLLPPNCDPSSSENAPARALAVSNRFGLTFFATVTGFCLVKTKELVELSQKLENDSPNIFEKCISTVELLNVRILALSRDEHTLAVCAGSEIRLYHVSALVHKTGTKPFELRSIGSGDTFVKDFQWCQFEENKYLIVSSESKLMIGRVEEVPTSIKDNVAAASWSADGKQIAYVVDMQLNIASPDLGKSFLLDLPAEFPGIEEGFSTYVDSLYWISPTSMLISYLQTDEDGEEIACPVFVLSATQGTLSEEGASYAAVTIAQGFPAVDSAIIPSGTGPYVLAEYLEPWKFVLSVCRRSIDEHVVLLGWLAEDDTAENICSFTLSNDTWRPSIPMSMSASIDIALTGLAIDRTSSVQQVDPRNVEQVLPPSPILLCSTLDSRLCLFSFLRLDEKWYNSSLVVSPASLDEISPEALTHSGSDAIATKEPAYQGKGGQGDDEDKSPKLNSERAIDTVQNVMTSPHLESGRSKASTFGQSGGSFSVSTDNQLRHSVSGFSASKAVNEQLRKTQADSIQGLTRSSRSSSSPTPNQSNVIQQSDAETSTRRPGPLSTPSVPAKVPSSTISSTLSQKNAENLSRGVEKPWVRPSGISDMEADFLAELDRVRKMGDEVDGFMSLIEGKSEVQSSSLTKSMVEKLERNISIVSAKCSESKHKLQEHTQLVEELRDQSLQVDAWRIYVESLVEQAGDSRYQDLWIHQKLHPEMDIKRKHVVNADQRLKQKIAELEVHLHTLELNQRQHSSKRHPKQTSNPGQFQSLQYLYNTVNAQMDAAEQLSLRLADMMELMNIPPSATSSRPRKLDSKVSCYYNSRSSVQSTKPLMLKSEHVSSTPSKSILGDDLGFPAPESARRRRNSMDSAWVGIGATKTTIKRVARVKPMVDNKELRKLKLLNSLESPEHQTHRDYVFDATSSMQFSGRAGQDTLDMGKLSEQKEAASKTAQSLTKKISGFTKPPSNVNMQVTGEKQPLPTLSFRAPAESVKSDLARSKESSSSALMFSKKAANDSSAASLGPQSASSPSPLASSRSVSLSRVNNASALPQAPAVTSVVTKSSGIFNFPSPSGVGTPNVSQSWVVNAPSPSSDASHSKTSGMFNNSSASLTVSSAISSNASGSLARGNSSGSSGSASQDTTVTSGNGKECGMFNASSAPTSSGLFSASPKALATEVPSQPKGSMTDSSPSLSFSSTISSDASASLNKSSLTLTTSSAPSASSSQVTTAPTADGKGFGTSSTALPASSPVAAPELFNTSSSGASALLSVSSTISSDASSSLNKSFGMFSASSGSSTSSSQGTTVTSANGKGFGMFSTSSTAPPASSPVAAPGLFNASSSGASALLSVSSTISSDASSSLNNSFGMFSASSGSSTSSSQGTTVTSANGKGFGMFSTSSTALPASSPVAAPGLFNASSSGSFSISSQTPTVATEIASNAFGMFSGSSSTFSVPSVQPANASAAPQSCGMFNTSSTPFSGSSAFPALEQGQQEIPSSQGQSPLPPATEVQEEDMDEEAPVSTSFSGFGSLGLGSSAPLSKANVNPFGVSVSPQSSPFGALSAPTGQLFRPAAFALPTSPPQATTFGNTGSAPAFSEVGAFPRPSNAGGFGQSPSGFGQPPQLGSGQQALGSALGAFGQARQVGFGSGIGVASSAASGFSSSTGGAFANAVAGGGFQVFSQKQTAGGFGGFGVASASNTSQTSSNHPLFTTMRK